MIRNFPLAMAAIFALGAAACDRGATDPDAGEEIAGWILFISDRDRAETQPNPDADIYGIRPDGTGVERLTSQPGQYADPVLSPDGFRLAFISDRDNCSNVWTMDPDGSDLVQLSGLAPRERCHETPRWSRDGEMIAFSSRDEPEYGWEVHVVRPDASGRANVSNRVRTREEGGDTDRVVGWSPDGRVVYHSNRDGPTRAYSVEVDGSDTRLLFDGLYTDPRWSPDGALVAVSGHEAGGQDVYVMDVARGEVRNATGGGGARLPAAAVDPWSPDGSRLVFERVAGAEIWVVNADGTGPQRVIASAGDDWFNAWSPDGERILFTSTRSGDRDIYIANPDGSDIRRLTSSTGDDWSAVWVPMEQ